LPASKEYTAGVSSTEALEQQNEMKPTWKAGGNTTFPPIAHASLSKDCSYSVGGDSVSDKLELFEG
jgi:hypothetical protein